MHSEVTTSEPSDEKELHLPVLFQRNRAVAINLISYCQIVGTLGDAVRLALACEKLGVPQPVRNIATAKTQIGRVIAYI